MIAFTKRLIVPQNVLLQELGGESVLLNLNTEYYFGLDETGTRMWSALTSSATIEAAFDVLLSEYDVAPAVLRRDLGALAENLIKHGLLELRDE
ncbi:MAG: PqqD family protein [Deltaproteobacteria bacterium]|nr:PqqD family protein [Deltaproteobacteria bacterium]